MPAGRNTPRSRTAAAVAILAVLAVAGIVWGLLGYARRVANAPAVLALADAAKVAKGDRLVRELVAELTRDPQAALWTSGSGLVHAVEAAVASVATGETPSESLRAFAPRQPFRVTTEGGRTVIDLRSYRRYDAAAEALAAVDAVACAAAFRRLEPLLEAEYREDGHPDGGFRSALARAISSLLDTTVPDGDVAVVPRVHVGVASAKLPESAVLVYEFADARLEALSPAQKQLLRMGARNAQLVQSKLEELARALELSLHRVKG
jgi:hypothetical protein